MVRSVLAALVATLACAGACDGPSTRTIRLARVEPGVEPECGAPADARQLIVSALGEFPVAPETAESVPVADLRVAIDKFPEATRVLTVQVLGLGGVVRAVGRTRALDFGALDDGDAVAVFMAPPRGVCPAASMAVARVAPLVARAGAGALVAGGRDADGRPVTLLERYDPDRGHFAVVQGALYGDEQLGLLGASMTSLADGRVVVAGGAREAYQVYDPVSDELSVALLLGRARARHAAVALPDGRLLLAGGCARLDGTGVCEAGTALADTSILDVERGVLDDGPALGEVRIDGRAIVEPDGRVLVVGGVDAAGMPVGRAERIDPGGGPSTGVDRAAGSPAALASGATLVAGDGQAWVVPPAGDDAIAIDAAELGARAGATVTTLDDGRVLVVGGADAAAPQIALYEPLSEGFTALSAAVPARRGHAAVALDDGSVLVLGGSADGGTALSDAWIYRHELTGPLASELLADIGDTVDAALLSPSSPRDAELGRQRLLLRGATGPVDRPVSFVVGGGPRFSRPLALARVGVTGGGAALLVGFESATRFGYVRLVPGTTAALVRVSESGAPRVACAGEPLAADSLAVGATLSRVRVDVSDDSLTASIDEREVLRCALTSPLPAGAVGVGVLGGPEAELALDALSATRGPR